MFRYFCKWANKKMGHTKLYIRLCEKINEKLPSKFYLAAGKKDLDLIDQFS